MSANDVETALADVPGLDPTGPSLATASAYVEIHRIAAGNPERQIGDKIIPAEDPDWTELRDRSLALLTQSKDLRLSVYFTLAKLKLEGIPGYRDGLAVILGIIERHWDLLHPRLDPEDDLDPQERINILLPLGSSGGYGDTLALERRLREAPLCDSRFARPSHRDISIARGEAKGVDSSGKPPLPMEAIQAAFRDTPIEKQAVIATAVAESAQTIKAINRVLVERVGEGRSPDFSRLSKTLAEIAGMIAQYGNVAKPEAVAAASDAAGAQGGQNFNPASAAISGEIRSKQDVQVTLEKICQYFDRHEPSSPIPLLLKGAQRLLKMNFIEIMGVLDGESLKCLMNLSADKDTK